MVMLVCSVGKTETVKGFDRKIGPFRYSDPDKKRDPFQGPRSVPWMEVGVSGRPAFPALSGLLRVGRVRAVAAGVRMGPRPSLSPIQRAHAREMRDARKSL
jgi:hypothetical protein